jgi:Heavy-metal-associated domain
VSVAIRKLDGVETVTVSLEKATAEIRFKPDNRLTLAEIREVIRKNGYPTRDAAIQARGRVVDRQGTPSLDLLNGAVLELAEKRPVSDTTVEITGVCRVKGKVDQLTITATK